MSQLITINTDKISGALFTEKTGKQVPVAKGVKADVIMTGYIGANEVKNDDGEYRATAFGRLPVEAAIHDDRMILSIAGGLRGVLFKATKDGVEYDYSGNIEAGDGNEYPIFGRKVKGRQGTFISISSLEKQPRKERDNKAGKPAAPAPTQEDFSDDIPF